MARFGVSLLTLLGYVALNEVSTAGPKRQSRWWFHTGSPAYINQAVELATQHRSSITGVYLYADFGVSANGTFLCPDDVEIQRVVKPLLDLGLSVGVALAFDQIAVQTGSVLKAAEVAAEVAARNHIMSLMVDYEPSTNITNAHTEAYSTAIRQFSSAMHEKGVQLDMCISGWGILDRFDLFQQTGVDSMMSMASTYFGHDIQRNEMWVQREQGQGVSPSQLHVGIGSTNSIFQKWDYKWTEHDFETFVTWLENNNVQNIDLWRTDIDSLKATNGTAPWIYERLEAFLRGEQSQQSAVYFV